jgi:hypothetical protein
VTHTFANPGIYILRSRIVFQGSTWKFGWPQTGIIVEVADEVTDERTGACCFPDGSCEDLTEEACEAADGEYQGDGTDCESDECENGAEVTFVPSDLNPGEKYHVVFITDDKRDGTSSDIADYNAFVQSQAEESGAITEQWGVSWSAIASTSDVNARDNISVDASPVYLVPFFDSGSLQPGSRVADDAADLWDGSIQVTIRTDQFGRVGEAMDVWTGTNVDGTAITGGLGGDLSRTGFSGAYDLPEWVSFVDKATNTSLAFYAVSEVLTVPAE